MNDPRCKQSRIHRTCVQGRLPHRSSIPLIRLPGRLAAVVSSPVVRYMVVDNGRPEGACEETGRGRWRA